jgi:hypothetical protein
MKAIYEILFMVKRDPGNLSDTRRVAGEASTKGFKRVVAWLGHADTVSSVGRS